jgi:hypothetical protein
VLLSHTSRDDLSYCFNEPPARFTMRTAGAGLDTRVLERPDNEANATANGADPRARGALMNRPGNMNMTNRACHSRL